MEVLDLAFNYLFLVFLANIAFKLLITKHIVTHTRNLLLIASPDTLNKTNCETR